MKTNRNTTLTLRAHSIRALTPSELRLAHGGVIDTTCGRSKALLSHH